MKPFKTTQRSSTHFLLIPLMIILILFTRQFPPYLLGFLGGFTVILFLFHSLIIEVKKERLHIKFGPGIIQKKIKMENIQNCQPIALTGLYRYGIHFNKNFTVYNVTGNQGVELTLRDQNKTIYVGTDEPESVCDSINAIIDQTEEEKED